MSIAEKTMFEIYRERDYNRAFQYILYTTLEEHSRNQAIAKAAAGDTVFHGFITDDRLADAEAAIEAIVDDLNDMDEETAGLPDAEIRRRLEAYLVE
jgi:hypothetical protein